MMEGMREGQREGMREGGKVWGSKEGYEEGREGMREGWWAAWKKSFHVRRWFQPHIASASAKIYRSQCRPKSVQQFYSSHNHCTGAFQCFPSSQPISHWNLPTHEISKYVKTIEVGVLTATVHIPTSYRLSHLMRVCMDRQGVTCSAEKQSSRKQPHSSYHWDAIMHILTEREVGTQPLVVACKAFPGPPAIVLSFLNNVDLFKLILTHITAENASLPLFGLGVASVDGAPPHIANAISIYLRSCESLVFEGIIVRNSV